MFVIVFVRSSSIEDDQDDEEDSTETTKKIANKTAKRNVALVTILTFGDDQSGKLLQTGVSQPYLDQEQA